MRYVFSGDLKIQKTSRYDVLIVGAGLAGLYTALHVSPDLKCAVLSKEGIDISNSWLAQGGIAAAVAKDDRPRFHYQDTLVAGAGLCDKKAVQVLVDEGPGDIHTLMSLHVPFDLDEEGDLQITREGGHNRNRVVHAGGDATGRETVKVLAALAGQRPNISFLEHTFFVDILTGGPGGPVTGALIFRDGAFELVSTRKIVICTGGIGQVYLHSTNPAVATGDGIAAAMRAGAKLRNMEFIQFHPTGLWSPHPEDRAFLISEAVRGEGGLLKNKDGTRFMVGVHELCELAPRDIVARAIVREMAKTGTDHVFLDITSKPEQALAARFPTIYNECLRRGINIARDYIPVFPVQHYLMGGIQTDLNGMTNISGLYACGEAAYTGVHGANRLASNSMLECLVFGRRAAMHIDKNIEREQSAPLPVLPQAAPRQAGNLDYKALRRKIQVTMNDYGYVIRTKAGLTEALAVVSGILEQLRQCCDNSKEYYEVYNVALVAQSILEAALARRESVGAHYRED
ncbi:L-aspartate oxidase [Papillibacter cinnamivorans]|uniref:L-aspartate oxidase n=1 Tax=Papillibacter cinnamivorans DSM 12816 TaxID=1122930 RepID=A0A1W1ZEI6_9FIRM|nr:L-aspartate oxidase [Papillibacter cinnamivorans]SMC46438.1 L-aspartate oxidase [Papillibacter cinnamivorans DSM 12816]